MQDAFLRWKQDKQPEVHSPRAYLATIVVRLCMDQLQSARAKREVYVGPWLPEPAGHNPERPDGHGRAPRVAVVRLPAYAGESLPLERAVLVLREVFDYDYPEIARTVDKSEANRRQGFHRARERLADRQSRFESSYELTEKVTEQFMRATTSGDVQELLRLLAADAVSIGDGGGKAAAGLRQIHSRESVSRGFVGNLRKSPPDRQWIEEVNGQPAIAASRGGQPYGVVLLEVPAGQVQVLYSIVNPGQAPKNHHFGRKRIMRNVRPKTRLPVSGNAALAAGALIQLALGVEFVLAGLSKVLHPEFAAQFGQFVAASPAAPVALLSACTAVVVAGLSASIYLIEGGGLPRISGTSVFGSPTAVELLLVPLAIGIAWLEIGRFVALAIRKRQFPIIGNGAGVWSFAHVADVASATLAAIERGAPGVYNVCDDEPTPVAMWLPDLAKAVGARPPWRVPVWLGRLFIGEAGVSMMTLIRGASNAKAKRELGWEPRYATRRDGFRSGLANAPVNAVVSL